MDVQTRESKKETATQLQDYLYQQMESQSDMCDVTLVIGGAEKKAHWCVLAVCPYFESLYNSNLKEKLAGKITLDFGDPSAIRAAICFLYTGTVEITDKNIREILQASDYLQIERLKKLCSRFLKFILITVKNCVGLCILGDLYNLHYVYKSAFKFMNGHLAQVLKEDEALTLAADSLVDMITNDNLSYVSVEQYFGFLIKWVEFDLLHREERFCDLFSHLNLSRVTNEFLTSDIERHRFVKNCVKCQTHLTDHREKLKTGEISQEPEEKEVVLVIGGKSNYNYLQSVDSFFAYIITENRWVQLPPLPKIARDLNKLYAASDGKRALYVMDDYRRFDHEQYVYKFVPGSNRWFELTVQLPTTFTKPCVKHMSCVGGKVFVIVSVKVVSNASGHGERTYHILELNEISCKFEEKCVLFTQDENLIYHFECCTAMGRYVCVCVWNHSNRTKGHNFGKFVYYDVERGTSKPLKNYFIAEKDIFFDKSKGTYFQQMLFARKNEVVLTHPGSNNACSFNLDSQKWRSRCQEFALPLMEEEAERTDFCFCYHEERLYLLGGRNRTTLYPPVNSVLKFNIEKKQCDSMENLPKPLTSAACCVMTLPTDLLRCHLDCPHCKSLGRPRHRQDSPPSSDDDDDISSDDDDMSYRNAGHEFIDMPYSDDSNHSDSYPFGFFSLDPGDNCW